MKLLRISSLVLFFATAVAVGSASASCSNASLVGIFGFLNAGLDAPGQPGTSVGQYNFDGIGAVTGAFTHSNGSVSNLTFTGTYSVSKNCTGTMVLNKSNGATENDSFVIDDGKHGMQIIDTDSGQVKPGFALAQGVVTCGLTGVKQTFAFNVTGIDDKGRSDAFVGQVILDGKGTQTGTETVSIGGQTGSGISLSGTYTERADCTGTMQLTSSLGGTSNLNFVVVNSGKEILLVSTDNSTIISGTAQH
jgi:hypothetical protein